jgi:hypothetical protein
MYGTVTCIGNLLTGFGLVNPFIGYSQVASTSNYNTDDHCNYEGRTESHEQSFFVK